ncbi:bifunctional phosphoribosylaminoimidazolecarboxamide formyltransferase/IMP cyclohydrolase [Fructilactobacillus sp. Tb1]|uniref:bifunctional phosphoribosylaminoimidazolecarboxamide formyltransferase/IMP cyclohydrolase n=1 Tax=Fructilactobacillus sp. Tb1 TaxID=3422304 RepID=UPI003D27A464
MKRALISVSDKDQVVEFAQGLVKQDYEIVSTGGTYKVLKAAGVPVIEIDEVTGFPEMLDGRVKTLHPNVHGGLLARRDDPKHMEQLASQNITPIDLVAVNLYPFKDTIQKEGVTEPEAIEQIDIGGPSMLRSAAKNFKDVLAVVEPSDYQVVLDKIANHEDDYEFRKSLAAKVFRTTAAYDALIAQFFTGAEFTPKFTETYEEFDKLRYGENPQQRAMAYKNPIAEPYSVLNANILHGKQLSYNNIRDIDASLRIIAEFKEPAVVTVKHMNPAGIGLGETINEAWNKAFKADDISIFGGIVALNRNVDLKTAEQLSKIFLEIIIAPSFDDDAFAQLAKKKNIRLLTLPFTNKIPQHIETVSILGGAVMQERDVVTNDFDHVKVVSEKQPTDAQLKAMVFAQNVVKHVKSNAIVVAKHDQTLGVGAGQPNRIDSVKIAIKHAKTKPGYDEAVLASDAFFPMDDSVQYAADNGIKAVIEPGGSIRDQDSIDKANELGVVLVFTGTRHFKH